MKTCRCQTSSQSGVALLLSLGFAGLLLVLVLAFATNAILENKVAYANSDRTQSRVFGDIALERALSVLRYYAKGQEDNATPDKGVFRLDNIVSRSDAATYNAASPTISTVGLSDALTSMAVPDAHGHSQTLDVLKMGSDIVAFYPTGTTDGLLNPNARRLTALEQMQWQYLYAGGGAADENNPTKVIGRIAYSVLPDIGTIHKSLFTENAGETAQTTPTRNGKSITEIPLSPFLNELDNGAGGAIAGAYGTIRNKLLAAGTFHPRQVLDGLLPTADARKASGSPRMIYSMLDMTSAVSSYSSSFRDGTALRDLFLLTQANLESYRDAAGVMNPNVLTALPYLSKLCDDKGGFDTLAARRNQIAANLIDYCDADSIPTSDIAASSWGPDGSIAATVHPSYTGNERTAYINEIAVTFGAHPTATKVEAAPTGSGKYYWTDMAANASLNIKAEIVNYFPLPSGVSEEEYVVRIFFTGSIISRISARKASWSLVPQDNWETHEKEYDIAVVKPYIDIPITVTGSGYFSGIPTATALFPDDNAPYSYNEAHSDAKIKVQVAGKNINIGQVVLLKKTESGETTTWAPVDYAKKLNASALTFPSSSGWGSVLDFILNAPEYSNTLDASAQTGKTFYYSAKDARQNLNVGDWSAGTAENRTTGDYRTEFPSGSFNAVNPVSQEAYANTDKPATGDPDLTAYSIRNGDMETAGELTLIHRGAPFETLNLTKTAPAGTTGTSYSNGDAGILNQVALETHAADKLNMNTRSQIIWQMIFQWVNYSPVKLSAANVLDTSANPTAVSEADAKKLAFATRYLIRKNKWFFESPADLLLPEGSTTRLGAILAEAASPDTNRVRETALGESGTGTVPAALTGDVAALTDAQKEALAAKIVPLLKCSTLPDSFYILVIAQGIQDVGGIGNPITLKKLNSAGTEVEHACQIGTFDFEANGGDPLYFDPITSNIRLLAKIKRTEDASGKSRFEVVNVEYLTE